MAEGAKKTRILDYLQGNIKGYGNVRVKCVHNNVQTSVGWLTVGESLREVYLGFLVRRRRRGRGGRVRRLQLHDGIADRPAVHLARRHLSKQKKTFLKTTPNTQKRN